jgi:hypothetical protein
MLFDMIRSECPSVTPFLVPFTLAQKLQFPLHLLLINDHDLHKYISVSKQSDLLGLRAG